MRADREVMGGAVSALPYREVWCLDFEFIAGEGERPKPVCMVAHELLSGREERLWLFSVGNVPPPFNIGDDVLFVAYYASAEMGCFLALGWPLPTRMLDLFTEFRA